MLATMVDEENLGFQTSQNGKIWLSSIYSTHLKLPISKLIFHSHNSQNLQDMQVIKSYIYTFSHKIELTYLNSNKPEKQTNLLRSRGHEKSVIVNTEVQNGYCVKYIILGDDD